jgi:protein TonB
MSRGRDVAGWIGAGAVAAGLFAGATAAALRAPPTPWGAAAVEVVALDMSVGVVAMAEVLPSEPLAVVTEVPDAPDLRLAEETPELQSAEPAPLIALGPQFPLQALLPLVADRQPVVSASPPAPTIERPPLDLAQSPRPPARPARRRVEEAAQVEQVAARAPEVTPPTAGAVSAAEPAQKQREAGGRDVARYGDLVMRQIAKQRRAKAPDRGVVVVGFEVGPDGGLRRIVVVATSGSAALDQVALDHIRRAAPFPPPPEGAKTRFSFEFEGR